MSQLELSTRDFWEVSRHVNGHEDDCMSTSEALKKLRNVQRRLGPQRLLYNKIVRLNNRIILGNEGIVDHG